MTRPHDRRRSDWTFFRQWLRNPLRTASLTPSSPELAAAMIAELPAGTRRIIELGGGTGALTRALLNAGIRGEELLVLELSEALFAHLHRELPQVRVVLGDARELPALAARCGYLDGGRADAIVSGLGFLSMSNLLQRDILAAAFDCLRDGGVFVQFTYGPISPVAESVVKSLSLQVRRGAFVLRNVPPATVYVYEKVRE